MSGGYQRNQAFYVSTGDPETVNDSPIRVFAPGQVGMFTTVKQPGPAGSPGAESYRDKVYRYVRTDSSMSTAPFRGAVAWWENKRLFRTTTSPTATGRGQIAGVYQNAITPGNYGFIQVGGPATVKIIDAPTASPTLVGVFVIPSSVAGKADVLGAGSAATYPPLGVTTGTYAAGQTEAIVDLFIPDLP